MSDSAKSIMADLIYTRRFIRLLITDFKDWDAFELGIIDEKGNVLKKRRQRKSSVEKKALTRFHSIVLTVKKTLEKISSNKVFTVVAALSLLREHCDDENISYDIMESSFMSHLDECYNITYKDLLLEDVPTTNTSTMANPEMTRYAGTSKKKPDINMYRRKLQDPVKSSKNKKNKKDK